VGGKATHNSYSLTISTKEYAIVFGGKAAKNNSIFPSARLRRP
jgi:hypothetical protein